MTDKWINAINELMNDKWVYDWLVNCWLINELMNDKWVYDW